MNKVRINQGRIVPFQFRMVGTALVLASMAGSLSHFSEGVAIIICIAISYLLPLIWSSFYILEIDPDTRTISEVTWITGMKLRKKTSFSSIEKIFVNETRKSQQMTSWGGKVRTSKIRDYSAFLKLSSEQKFFLLSDKDPENLLKKLDPMAKKLQCEVVTNY